MCDINKQTQDDAKQTNRFPRYQLLRKETNNINRRRRQLLGSHARFIENSQDVTNTNTRRKTIKRSTLLIIRYHKQTMEFSLFFLFVYLKPKEWKSSWYTKLSYVQFRKTWKLFQHNFPHILRNTTRNSTRWVQNR